ncbi:MAG: putative Ig domain-containing protein, partial [Propionibacteriaceae bacterium]|nr:putative Ig domain-containing protein [Propionibacteriaceae bacterium]
PITWSVTAGALPTGLTLDPATGEISGTPTTLGTSTFTVQALNTIGSDSKQFTITITQAPVISPSTLPDGTVGTPYTATLIATGTTPITWTVTNSALPVGLMLDPNTGGISGIPTAAGTYHFQVTATNAYGADTATLTITINQAPPTGQAPSILTTTLLDGVVGEVYRTQTLTATGTTPITWTVTNGALPDGLTLTSDGQITGTPTVAGVFTFTVTASNGVSPAATATLSITINELPVIITQTLPDGWVGRTYGVTLIVTGTPPITWSLAGGMLPSGLTMSTTGQITGIPIVAGVYTFTVSAINPACVDPDRTYTITVHNVGPRPSISPTHRPASPTSKPTVTPTGTAVPTRRPPSPTIKPTMTPTGTTTPTSAPPTGTTMVPTTSAPTTTGVPTTISPSTSSTTITPTSNGTTAATGGRLANAGWPWLPIALLAASLLTVLTQIGIKSRHIASPHFRLGRR